MTTTWHLIATDGVASIVSALAATDAVPAQTLGKCLVTLSTSPSRVARSTHVSISPESRNQTPCAKLQPHSHLAARRRLSVGVVPCRPRSPPISMMTVQTLDPAYRSGSI